MIQFEKGSGILGGAGIVKVWVGQAKLVPRPDDLGTHGTLYDEREPDFVVSEADMDHFVVEWLRGPRGHTGPMGAMGLTGRDPLIGG